MDDAGEPTDSREPARDTVTMESRDVSEEVRPPSSTAPPPKGAGAASCTGASSVPAATGTSLRTGSPRNARLCRAAVVARVVAAVWRAVL